MIDLHLHTTASDGHLTPVALVQRASAAGLTTISVTDHDTVAAVREVAELAAGRAMRAVPGIEITAVVDGRDIHVLGYFFDVRHPGLARFLETQRALRVVRLREIGARLTRLGAPVDVEGVLLPAAERPGTSVGRPLIARALVEAGHVSSVQEAFDRYLATGQSAFVPRTGRSPSEVVAIIHEAGGIASFAHPGVTARDAIIEPLVDAGLDAIEVYHSDHTPETTAAYLQLARRLGVGVTGGSDFHGEPLASPPAAASRPGERSARATLGVVSLPHDELAGIERIAAGRTRRS